MNNGTTTTSHQQQQACAACKHQRRKCGPNCILAPYFPPDRQKQFLNAHKLFGVGKISKMIKEIDPHLRDTAMATILYQADMRAADPVGGCSTVIHHLQSQIEYCNAELHLTRQHLALLRAQQQQQQGHYEYHAPPPPSTHYVEQTLMAPQQLQNPQLLPYYGNSNPNYDPLSMSEVDANVWDVNSIPLSPLSLHDKKDDEGGGGDDDEKPILDLINEMNSDTSNINLVQVCIFFIIYLLVHACINNLFFALQFFLVNWVYIFIRYILHTRYIMLWLDD